MGKNTKQAKQKNSTDESLLAEVAKLRADNFLLSNPAGLTTVGPLPSTAGGNAAPVSTPVATTIAPVNATPTATAPVQPMNYSSSTYQSENMHDTKSMNRDRIEKIEAENEAEIARVDNMNSLLPAEMKRLNDDFATRPKGGGYDSAGSAQMYELSPAMPLPIMPRLKEVPNEITGSFGSGYTNHDRQSGGRPGSAPKINPDIPLFYRDANGKISIKYAAYDSPEAQQKSNDMRETEWYNQSDLGAMKDQWVSSAFKNEGAGLKSGKWKLKSYNGTTTGAPADANAEGDMFDMARASVLSSMLKSNKNAVVIKNPDGSLSNADENIARKTSAQNFRFNDSAIWGNAKDPKTGETVKVIVDENAYNKLKNSISEFLTLNGWSQGQIPNKKSAIFQSFNDDYRATLSDPNVGRKTADVFRSQLERTILTHFMKANQ
jgi:hypothetical protein